MICATNFAESLDSALTRPGRLDKIVVVPLPDLQGRQEVSCLCLPISCLTVSGMGHNFNEHCFFLF